MSKRLVGVLALAFVVSIACAAYAEVQNVKVSGDITAFGIYKTQFGLLKSGDVNSNGNLKTESAMASIARVKVDADLTDNVIATIRLLNERYWGSESSSTSGTGVDIDLAYVTLKKFLDSPLTLTVGRQNLRFGNAMIIGDPDTNNAVSTRSPFSGTRPGDASLGARKAFDAVRATLDYNPLVVDLVYSKINENLLTNSDDVNLIGANAAYAVNDNTKLEAYYFRKATQKKAFTASAALGHSKGDHVDTIGTHIGNVNTNNNIDITSTLEAAYQFGKFNDTIGNVLDRSAWAGEAAVTLGFKNVQYTPSLTLLASIFSGADKVTKTYKGWDPMFEDQSFGDIANQSFNQSGARLLGAIGTVKATEDVMLKGEYYAYWWDVKFVNGATAASANGYNFAMTDKRFAGQEVDLTATYDYTEDVQFSLMTGFFMPGDSFAKSDSSGNTIRNMASEVIGSMKVAF